MRNKILELAVAAVNRQGIPAPEDQFQRIADCMNAMGFEFRGGDVKAQHFALIMVLLKVARQFDNPDNVDNCVDMAGYAACCGEAHAFEVRQNMEGP